MELMIKREAEKETQEDLKQVFRVFDKVSLFNFKVNFHKTFNFVIRMGTDLCQLRKLSLSYPSKSEMRDAASHGNFESDKFFMVTILFPFHSHFESPESG